MYEQHGGRGQVFRITGARTGLAEDVRARQRRYVIAMSVRTLSVVLAIVLWDVERYIAMAALVLGLLLPYVAVVIANAGRERPPALPTTFVAPWDARLPAALPTGREMAAPDGAWQPPRAAGTGSVDVAAEAAGRDVSASG
ncbi:DUF3099 domain-containing protein [Streptomyces sp. NPDC050534]|uniref:DUF3099 domain-containing protein n=1 Tax=unclassified Streptomyces TaxID=2593676 RepID=UPI00379EC55D